MHRLISWIETTLVPALGPFGVFVVSFLDSSFLSFPELTDLLVVAAAVGSPAQAPLFVAMATLGSLAGCLSLWEVGRRGGDARLIKLFGPERVARARRAFERFDVLALAVPALLPPPMPFKIFVLTAAVLGMPRRRFALTLLVARSLRYTAWSALGVAYHEEGLRLLQRFDAWFHAYARTIGLGAVVVLVLVVAWRLRPRPGA